MRALIGVVAALAIAVPSPAGAVPTTAEVREFSVQVPGVENCEFHFEMFSQVIPRKKPGYITAVEVAWFKVTGTGQYCDVPMVPTQIDIYDRSPKQWTYHTKAAFGARQDVDYVGLPQIQTGRDDATAVLDAATMHVSKRTNGLVAFEFRAPLLGVCVMDLWEVLSPGIVAPLGSLMPCPVVEP